MLATPRRAIAYPNPDRSDRPDVPTHIYNVAIASDGSVIYNQGTSAARLSASHQTSGGRIWWETDTLLAWYDDGTTWSSIGVNPNGSLAFTGATSKLSFTTESLAANTVIASKVSGDTNNRITIGADGKISWGSGGGSTDTFLYRSGVGIVKTDGTLNAVSGYQVNGTALASTHLSDTALLARLAGPTFSTPVAISDTIANVPAIRLIASDASVDYKNWRERVNGTQLIAEVRNDALSVSAAWLTVTRSGAAISTVNFPNGTLQYAGNEVAVLSNPTFIGTVTSSKLALSDTIANIPLLKFVATDAATDSKNWRAYVDGTHLRFDIANDALSTLVNWLVVTRSGATVTSVNFPNGTLQYAGNEVAVLASPAFTGSPTSTTQATTDSSTKLATTAFVRTAAPGTKIAYTTFGATVDISTTTEAGATSVAPGASATYDGTETEILLSIPGYKVTAGLPTKLTVVLLRDSTVLGQIPIQIDHNDNDSDPITIRFYDTPSAASHTYSAKAFVDTGTVQIQAGAGGSGATVNGYIRTMKG